jgi:hypothetical protein
MNATVRDVESEDSQGSRLVVDAMTRSSKAFQAGLRLGDVIRRFQGVEVATQNELLTLVSRLPSGRRVTLNIEREREDGRGVHERELTFRLEPLWSGPQQGEWASDPKLVEAETQAVLAAHRANEPPVEWTREERVLLPDGGTELRVIRLKGRWIRVESGPPGRRTVEVVAERAFRLLPDGTVERLPAARRDALAGTAEALRGLAVVGGEAELTHLLFTGGELLHGRMVVRVESRDRAGRERLLYLDTDSHVLVGMAFPETQADGSERWIEEVHTPHADGVRILRVDFESGEVLERAEAVVRVEVHDEALFQRPADEGQEPGGGGE